MKQTYTNSDVRNMNQRQILDTIFNSTYISKAELARTLNMSKTAIASNVAVLLNTGIICEHGESEEKHVVGRKPMLLKFASTHQYIIAFDFYLNSSLFVLSDLRGNFINQIHVNISPLHEFNQWLEAATAAISSLISGSAVPKGKLLCIAVSWPGIINPATCTVICHNQLFSAIDALALKTALNTHFDVPVILRNSANASVLGELYMGAGQEITNLLYITCGLGVGAGVIVNGELLEGKQFAAGEIAKTRLFNPQVPGTYLQLEDTISISAVLQYINENIQEVEKQTSVTVTPVDFTMLLRLWQQKTPFVVEYLHSVFTILGNVIANLCCLLNCEKIVIGGEYLAFGEEYITSIQQSIQKYAVIPAEVVASNLHEYASIHGMIVLARNLYFEDICSM